MSLLCPFCITDVEQEDYKVYNDNAFYEHVRNWHSEKNDYGCKDCGDVYPTAGFLNRHVQDRHMEQYIVPFFGENCSGFINIIIV